MDRVGKYLLVLLIIWIPNLLVNFYQEIYGSAHTKYEVLIEVRISFSSHPSSIPARWWYFSPPFKDFWMQLCIVGATNPFASGIHFTVKFNFFQIHSIEICSFLAFSLWIIFCLILGVPIITFSHAHRCCYHLNAFRWSRSEWSQWWYWRASSQCLGKLWRWVRWLSRARKTAQFWWEDSPLLSNYLCEIFWHPKEGFKIRSKSEEGPELHSTLCSTDYERGVQDRQSNYPRGCSSSRSDRCIAMLLRKSLASCVHVDRDFFLYSIRDLQHTNTALPVKRAISTENPRRSFASNTSRRR